MDYTKLQFYKDYQKALAALQAQGTKANILKELQFSPDIVKDLKYTYQNKGKQQWRKEIAHLPKEVASFFRLFVDPDAFKFLTHDWAGYDVRRYNYQKVRKKAIQVFDEKTKSYAIPKQLYKRLEAFLKSEAADWFYFKNGKTHRPKLGWSAPKVRAWCEQNKGFHPVRNEEFSEQMIQPFKRSIEIKNNRDLNYMVQRNLKLKLGKNYINEFDIKYINLEKANFYTDYFIIEAALQHILQAIKERANAPYKKRMILEVKRSVISGFRQYQFIITHLHSKPNCPADLSFLLKNDLRTIENLLFGLCDWSIEAHFEDGYWRIPILYEGLKKVLVTDQHGNKKYKIDRKSQPNNRLPLDQKPLGFKHVLTFYA